MKLHLSLRIYKLLFINLLVLFCISFTPYAHAATYYFNNAVDTSPATVGNYWNNVGATVPAGVLPNLAVDQVSILTGANYVGDAVFNGGAGNNGTVTGNATFSGDFSENAGTVTGTKTRYYTTNIINDHVYPIIETTRGFILDGPWTVVADGVTVSLSFFQNFDITYDNTTTLTTLNGGSFRDIVSPYYANGNTIYLSYYNLDETSLPATSDFQVTINSTPVTVTDVDVSYPSLGLVTLTLASSVNPEDLVSLDYTPGVNPLRSSGTPLDYLPLDNLSIPYAIPIEGSGYPAVIGTKLYMPNGLNQAVSVIDTTNNTVVDTIPIGNTPSYLTTFGVKVYSSNTQNDNVSVIDTTNNTVVATIPVGNFPQLITTLGTNVYVINSFDETVSVIDTTTDTVVATLPVGDDPSGFWAVGTKLYVPNFSDDNVSVIDTTNNTIIDTISVGVDPYAALSVGTKLYVPNNTNNNPILIDTVSVIDTTTDTVIDTISVGKNPSYLTLVGTKVYVNNFESDTVSVIDTTTDTVVATIPIGIGSYYPTVLGTKVYVLNRFDSTVSVIDSVTDTVVDTILVGYEPIFMTVLGTKIYVINSGNGMINPLGTGQATLSIIDTTLIPSQLPNLTSFSTSASSGTYTQGQSIPITAHFGRTLQAGSTMTITVNTGRSITLNDVSGSTLSGTYTVGNTDTTPDLSVSEITSANVSDLNGHTRTSYDLPASVGTFTAENSFITRNLGDSKNIVIGPYISIETGDNPYQISTPVTVSGIDYLYVANQGGNSVSVIRISDNTPVDTIPVGSEPYGLSVVGTNVYVANIASNTVSVIDTLTNTVTATISVGLKPYYVETLGTNVYVTNGQSNTVSVINSLTNTVTATIPVGSYPRGIKAHGTDLYVANYGDPNYSGGNYISVIDSLTNTVTDTIITSAGSDGPRGVTTLNDTVYVTNFRSNTVSVINTATNTITHTIDVGVGPRGILGSGTTLYVENFDDGTISIIDTNTNTVTDTIDVGHSPAGMRLVNTDLYISLFQDDRISIFDTVTNTLRQNSIGGSRIKYGSISTITPITPPLLPVDTTACTPGDLFSRVTGARCTETPSSVVPPLTPPVFTFTKTLQYLSEDLEVKQLQIYLNTHGFIVSQTGAGSPGKETTFFGTKTKQALINLQEAHKTEILTPLGLTKGTGIFGTMTRSWVNAQ